MKRKEYQKPAMQVVKLQPIKILASSDDDNKQQYEPVSW
jgi:hypothetical protein